MSLWCDTQGMLWLVISGGSVCLLFTIAVLVSAMDPLARHELQKEPFVGRGSSYTPKHKYRKIGPPSSPSTGIDEVRHHRQSIPI